MASRARLSVHDVLHIEGVYEAALRMLAADFERTQTNAEERGWDAAIEQAMRQAHRG